MNIQKIAQIAALSVIFVAGGAAAQTAGTVNVSSTPVTTGFSAGANQTIGTLTLSGVNGGGSVTALPVAVTAANGGVIGNLSNCQVFNNAGTSLTSGSNVINSFSTNGNTFTLNSPLAVNASTGTMTLSVRCDVSSSTPNGSTFTLSFGAASLGPVLRINLDTAPSVPAGSNDVALANISVGATGASFNVTSIPLTISSSANGSVGNLSDCKIRDASNLDATLSSVATVINGNVTTFNFAAPLFASAGTANMLSLTCDVQPSAAVGSTYMISVTPGNVRATNASTGAAVTPVGIPAGGTGPLGLPASTSGSVIVSAAGTTPVTPGTSTGTGTGSTPGVPNTGLGSAAGLLSVIAIAGIIALLGAIYLGRKQEV